MTDDRQAASRRLPSSLSRSASPILACVLAVSTFHSSAAEEQSAAPPENLAPRASISASSEFSDQYLGKLVADGVVPSPMSQADVGKAWCAQGNQHPQGVSLTLTWSEAVSVAEIVYFGRTAWQWEENWKDYEVYSDSAEEPVAKGELKPGHGPQRIACPNRYGPPP